MYKLPHPSYRRNPQCKRHRRTPPTLQQPSNPIPINLCKPNRTFCPNYPRHTSRLVLHSNLHQHLNLSPCDILTARNSSCPPIIPGPFRGIAMMEMNQLDRIRTGQGSTRNGLPPIVRRSPEIGKISAGSESNESRSKCGVMVFYRPADW